MIPLPDIRLYSGPKPAEPFAMLWESLEPADRRALLWDCPPERKRGQFLDALNAAPYAVLALMGGEPLGACWLHPLAPNVECAALHLCFARPGRPHARDFGALFLGEIWPALPYQSLLGLVPAPFRHIRAFAAALGFESGPILPGACRLASFGNRLAAGQLLILKRKKA